MKKKNFYQFKNLKNVVFLGYSEIFEKLVNINNKLKIKSEIITSKSFKKKLNKKFDFKVFNKIDNNFLKYIEQKYYITNTLFISFGARWIFSKKIIERLNGKLLNFHGSRLPLDAGGGSFSWRIMKNDRINNLLVHLVSEKIDEGDIIFHKKNLFKRSDKLPIELKKKYLFDLELFYEEFMSKLKKQHKFDMLSQPDYLSTYYPRLDSKKDSWIDWTLPPFELEKFINAFDDPFIGAKTKINNKVVNIKSVQLHGGETIPHKYMTGLIVRNDKKWIVVCSSGNSYLIIEKVLNEKKKNIINEIKPGDRFYTPLKNLIYSKSKRTKYGK